MSSAGYKAMKADLVAIYRLEFYRKQTNWKLSQGKAKNAAPRKPEKTSSAGSNTVLNQTYNLEVEGPEIEESPLNEAFVESDGSDKNLEPNDSPEDTSTKTSNPALKSPPEQNLQDQKLPENWTENGKPANWLQEQMVKQWKNLPPAKDSENQFLQTEDCPERDNCPQMPKNVLKSDIWSQMPKDCPKSDIWSQTPIDCPISDIWSQTPVNDTWSQMPKECAQSEIWLPPKGCPENNIWPQTFKNCQQCEIRPEMLEECIHSKIWQMNKNYSESKLPPQMPQEPHGKILQPARDFFGNNLWPQMAGECPCSEIWQSKECPANNIWSNPEFGWTDASEQDLEKGWPISTTNIWPNMGRNLQVNARVDEPLDLMDQEMDRESGKLVSAAEEWLQDPVCAQWVQDNADRVSQDSLSEFMRGAHCAPHSSELELRLPAADMTSVSDISLCQVTTTTLQARIRSHVCALRLLLREAASRDQLSFARNSPGFSGDSLPTRDVASTDFVAGSYKNCAGADVLEGGRGRGRLNTRLSLSLARHSLGYSGDSLPPSDTAPTDFVAGSYRSCAGADVLEGGRGRGRLHTRVIAIGAGRPYRL